MAPRIVAQPLGKFIYRCAQLDVTHAFDYVMQPLLDVHRRCGQAKSSGFVGLGKVYTLAFAMFAIFLYQGRGLYGSACGGRGLGRGEKGDGWTI